MHMRAVHMHMRAVHMHMRAVHMHMHAVHHTCGRAEVSQPLLLYIWSCEIGTHTHVSHVHVVI